MLSVRAPLSNLRNTCLIRAANVVSPQDASSRTLPFRNRKCRNLLAVSRQVPMTQASTISNESIPGLEHSGSFLPQEVYSSSGFLNLSCTNSQLARSRLDASKEPQLKGEIKPPRQSRASPRTRDVWRRSEAGSSPKRQSQNAQPREKQRTVFEGGLSEDPTVAIIGGGLSGLVCAQVLSDQGVRSTVFDTGKRGLGGRLATRHVSTPNGQSLVFDHAAQYFTVSDPVFQKMVNEWEAEGLVDTWQGRVGNLSAGVFTPLPGEEQRKYVGTKGMMALADGLGETARRGLVQTRRPCWVSRMEPSHGKWRLSENGRHEGDFDFVVIAHNGKCANRLLAPAGVPQVAAEMKSLRLSSIWALLAAFDEPLPLPPEAHAAFVQGIPSVSWICNNNRKLKRNGPECWTLFSTAAYGKENKVPQEAVPTPVAAKVTREMLEGLEDAWNLPRGTIPAPIFTRTQLWGAALPTNAPGVPCIFDPLGRVGICGDWLTGSSMQDAALSGRAMALQIAKFCQRRGVDTEDLASGLTKRVRPIGGPDIGSFPTAEMELLTVA